MNNTVVAIFDEYGQAQQAMNALFNEGFTHSDVKLSPAEESPQLREEFLRSRTTGSTASTGSSWGIGDFFRSLFGTDQHGDDAGVYSEAVRRGSYMLSVDASNEDEADRAAGIMQRYNAIDLDQRATHWRSTGWTGYQSDAPLYTADQIRQERAGYVSSSTVAGTGSTLQSEKASATGESIPVVQEQLQVGKRAVQRGGVRIYRHVTETPVQESVQLKEERVTVERTPVNEPASAADIEAFKEGTIEVRETAEEPVIAKTARVVEEVNVGKEVTEHTEIVSDTVRRTDVEVEQLGAVGDDAFRQHWQSAYGSGGGKYEDYAQAYRYGANLAGNKQYQGYRWDELEPKVRSDWESTHAGSPWEHTKQAVRYGWEKMTGS